MLQSCSCLLVPSRGSHRKCMRTSASGWTRKRHSVLSLKKKQAAVQSHKALFRLRNRGTRFSSKSESQARSMDFFKSLVRTRAVVIPARPASHTGDVGRRLPVIHLSTICLRSVVANGSGVAITSAFRYAASCCNSAGQSRQCR